jgi:hypothetical protein
VIVQPSFERWHVPHERPLVPSDWKNGFVVSTVFVLVALCAKPYGFGAARRSGAALCSADSDAPTSSLLFSTLHAMMLVKQRRVSSDVVLMLGLESTTRASNAVTRHFDGCDVSSSEWLLVTGSDHCWKGPA